MMGAPVQLAYSAPVEVHAMSPIVVRAEGGSLVTVTGTNFGRDTHCIISDRAVDATIVSSALLICETADHGQGMAPLEIADGSLATATHGGLSLAFVPSSGVESVEPAQGPLYGGTQLTLRGSEFVDSNELSCRVGSVRIEARWLGSHSVECIAPAHAGGPAFVSVTMDRPQETLEGSLYEAIINDPSQATKMFTEISKSYFNGAFLGEFYGVPVVADAFTSNGGGGVDGQLPLMTSFYGLDSALLSSVLRSFVQLKPPPMFVFREEAVVASISPPASPTAGGMPVTLTGLGSLATAGPTPSDCVTRNAVTDGPPVDHVLALARCTMLSSPHAGFMALEARASDARIGSSAVFEFHEPPSIRAIFPRIGAAEGGTVVWVSGANLVLGTGCDFGGMAVKASERVSSVLVACESPPTRTQAPREGPTTLDVFRHQVTAEFGSGLTFTFAPTSVTEGVSPTRGSLEGGTLLSVAGRGFIDTEVLACRLGTIGPLDAQLVSAALVTCIAPAHRAGHALISVTLNGPEHSVIGQIQGNTLAGDPVAAAKLFADVRAYRSIYHSLYGFEGAGLELLGNLNLLDGPNGLGLLSGSMDLSTQHYLHAFYGLDTVLSQEMLGKAFDRFVETKPPTVFTYSPRAEVDAVLPAAVTSAGGGAEVTLFGTGFRPGEAALCILGAHSAVATEVSSGRVQCSAGAVVGGLGGGPGFVRVEVSGSEAELSTAGELQISTTPLVRATLPREAARAGGGLVWLNGRDLDLYGVELSCVFGTSSVDSRRISSALAMCETPPMAFEGVVMLSVSASVVSLQQHSGEEGGVPFAIKMGTALVDATPDAGPVTGGTVVTLHGRGFPNAESLGCRFGAIGPVLGHWQSPQSIECTSPSHYSATAPLEEGWLTHSTSGELTFGFRRQFVPYTIDPSAGPPQGGVTVSVYGRGWNHMLDNRAAVGPSFGAVATQPCRDRLVLSLPVRTPGFAELELALPWAAHVPVQVGEFEYAESPGVRVLLPRQGPVGGGTVMHTVGFNFRRQSTSVAIGASIDGVLPTAFVSSAVVVSETQAVPSEGALSAAVSNVVDSGTFHASDSSMSYLFTQPVEVYHLSRNHGHERGGTLIELTGSGFRDSGDLWCKVGPITVRASGHHSMNFIFCVTPGRAEGRVPLEASSNYRDYSEGHVLFSYFGIPRVTALAPASGGISGGQEVAVSGESFQVLSPLHCRFGLTVVAGASMSDALAVCFTPPHAAGFVSLEVTVNNGNYTTDGHYFEYTEMPVVGRILPANGRAGGGTVVTLVGDNFVHARTSCRFGVDAEAPATFVSTTLVSCEAPRVDLNYEFVEGPLAVEASTNGQDYSRNYNLFRFSAASTVTTVTPSSGPTRGGTFVTVSGANFLSDDDLYCKFGPIAPVAAQALQDGQLRCRTPAHSEAQVPVEIGRGTIAEFSISNITFTF